MFWVACQVHQHPSTILNTTPHSCMIFGGCGGHTRMGCVWCNFQGCKGHRRAFSEDASSTKVLCDLEWPWVGHRSLSTEREHRLKVGGAWQIMGTTGGNSGARASVEAWASILSSALALLSNATIQSGLDGGGDKTESGFNFVQKWGDMPAIKTDIFQFFYMPSPKFIPSLTYNITIGIPGWTV